MSEGTLSHIAETAVDRELGKSSFRTEVPADSIDSLFGKIFVVVAHQDDETACAFLLQRAREAQVVFATDGAPTSGFFWSQYGSREQYAAVRRSEASQSLAVLEMTDSVFLEDAESHIPFHDQELYRSLPAAMESLERLVYRFKPDALLAPAYEGGHPDHDACSFLVNQVGERLSLPRWEMPLYHRSQSGELVHQAFRVGLGDEIVLCPTELELHRRGEMLSKYVSQPEASIFVSSPVERFRLQPNYDYLRPPHSGALNYEVWGWPMRGTDLCRAFCSCNQNSDAHEMANRSRFAPGEASD
jgi:LmbE family N-acetylglucosaminyl deacetylase